MEEEVSFIKNCTLALIISLLYSWVVVFADHGNRLNILKRNGFKPRVIYDIGAHEGEWAIEIKKIFKRAKFFLFEANDHHTSLLRKSGFPYFIATLGDREEMVTFYTLNDTGDSIFCEQSSHYQEGKCVEKHVQMTTLDAVVKKNNLPLPDLIKMDVQGAEKLIIQGAPSVFCNAEVIILEASILEYNKNAPLIYEIMTLMYGLGYRVLDFLGSNYLPSQELLQVDILFVRNDSSLIKKEILC